MARVQKNKAAKRYRFLRRWGLVFGIPLIAAGYAMVEERGFSTVKSYRDWYVVYAQEMNSSGYLGMGVCIAGGIFLVLWLCAVLALKAATPCPACGGLLTQKSPVCPYCHSRLSWSKLDDPASGGSPPAGAGIRYCPSCGARAEPGSLFCGVCGRKFTNQ